MKKAAHVALYARLNGVDTPSIPELLQTCQGISFSEKALDYKQENEYNVHIHQVLIDNMHIVYR